jgi:hypothetical protein
LVSSSAATTAIASTVVAVDEAGLSCHVTTDEDIRRSEPFR